MSLLTKPMLAPTETPSDFVFPMPCLASPKFDGIRCVISQGKVLSRSFKLIPNKQIRKFLSNLPEELDGELVGVNQDGSLMTFNETQSVVMSEDGGDNFIYFVFDYVSDSLAKPYEDRMKELAALDLSINSYVKKVLPKEITSIEELDKYEAECLADGFEGVMVRLPKGGYKCGRATLNQKTLIKVKRFVDSEICITGFVELMHNDNEATKDEFGRTKRSKAKGGLVPAGTLGKFLGVELGNFPWKGQEVEIGTGKGLTAKMRKDIWDNQANFLGKICVYKFQKHGSTDDKPRIPVWKGFRDPIDMGE